MTLQKLNLWNHGIGLHVQKDQEENVNLLKISLLVQIGAGRYEKR